MIYDILKSSLDQLLFYFILFYHSLIIFFEKEGDRWSKACGVWYSNFQNVIQVISTWLVESWLLLLTTLVCDSTPESELDNNKQWYR